MAKLNVTELDFDQIKDNLKTYLKNQDAFTDYDFDGSGLNILLDVLAYNTHYNALNAHYALNEAFLGSAQIRGNVVTRAKMLGYIPRSVLAPAATINISVVGGTTTPDTLTLPRGTKFTTNIDNVEYTFVSLSEKVAPKITPGDGTTGYLFSNVEIVEGTLKNIEYVVNNNIEGQKFQLPDTDIDTSTLSVKVKANSGVATGETYTLYENDIADTTAASKVYWLQQNANEYYEVYFGDGTTGVKPETNNVVNLSYVYSNATAANGASTFTLASTLLAGSIINITTITNASGGLLAETIESVRFNAPLKFAAQNRAVTGDDYRAIIKAGITNIDSISVWGGEENEIPDFGKVYIAIKPSYGNVLSEENKSKIIDDVLKGKTVASITPILIDVDYTYLELDVNVRYNPNLTDRTNNEIITLIGDTISNYSYNQLNSFSGVFRHSELLGAIDSAEPSVLSSSVRPRMFKNVTLATTGINDNTLKFASAIYAGKDPDWVPTWSGNTGKDVNKMNITSTKFTYNGEDHYIGDRAIYKNTTERDVVIYKINTDDNVSIIKSIGKLNFAAGTVAFSGFVPDAETTIKITIIPDSLDIAPKREQLISIDSNYVTVVAEVDNFATSGQTGGIDYVTTTRFK